MNYVKQNDSEEKEKNKMKNQTSIFSSERLPWFLSTFSSFKLGSSVLVCQTYTYKNELHISIVKSSIHMVNLISKR